MAATISQQVLSPRRVLTRCDCCAGGPAPTPALFTVEVHRSTWTSFGKERWATVTMPNGKVLAPRWYSEHAIHLMLVLGVMSCA